MESVLVTGAAGFIGFHLSARLLESGWRVIGLDHLNGYYDIGLKRSRLALLGQSPDFLFCRQDLLEKEALTALLSEYRPEVLIHLAAQAGVRYSIAHPQAVVDANLVGFMNVLEACRQHPVRHLIYASSSSVYGGNRTVPFSTRHHVDHPLSLYAATKKANELMAHTYSHLYGIPTTGLRFFTVYGPWGRPDMAYFSFTKHIFEGKPIRVFNHGKMERDFTYIDDAVEGICRLIPRAPEPNPHWDERSDDISGSFAPYKIYNIGNRQPVALGTFISVLEEKIGKRAVKVYVDMQPGDVPSTFAEVSDLEREIGFRPKTGIEEGLGRFVDWYREYYG